MNYIEKQQVLSPTVPIIPEDYLLLCWWYWGGREGREQTMGKGTKEKKGKNLERGRPKENNNTLIISISWKHREALITEAPPPEK